jgi:hypothetical protein
VSGAAAASLPLWLPADASTISGVEGAHEHVLLSQPPDGHGTDEQLQPVVETASTASNAPTQILKLRTAYSPILPSKQVHLATRLTLSQAG